MNRPSILCAALWPELPLPAHAAADAGAAPDVAHEFNRVQVTATRSATRFGIGGIRFRGLDGNRVRIHTAPGAKFNVGVFNLADRRHVEWSAITGTLGSTSTVVDRFSNPGRTVSASLAVSW